MAAAAALTLSLARSAPTEAIVSVQVLTDRLEPVAGGVLRLADASASATMRTDADGDSPWVRVHTRDGLELVLAERELPAGILLGTRAEVPFPYRPDDGSDALLVQLSRTPGTPPRSSTSWTPMSGVDCAASW